MKKLRFNIQTEQKFKDKLDARTYKSYRAWCDQLYEYTGYKPLRSIKIQEINNFFHYLINEKKYSPSSLHIAIAAIRFLYSEILNVKYNLDHIKTPYIERENPVSIDKERVKALLDSISNIKHKSIITLIYAAGLDISEVINVKVKDIKDGKLLVRGKKDEIIRETILGEYMMELLREYWKAYKPVEFLFEGQKDGSKYSPTSIRNVFNRAKKKTNLDEKFTPRHLKYSYVKHLQDEGFKTIDILKHIGLNAKTIEFYSQIDSEYQDIEFSPLDTIYGKKQSKSIKLEITNEQVENMVFTDFQTKQLIEKNPELIRSFIENDITHSDIIALGYRKKQLDIFAKLLNDSEYFNQFKTENEISKTEQVWQTFFESNPWIFGHGLNYIFSSPLEGRKLEQVVSGYDFNSSGKRVDGLLKTRGLISSLCFVEIKTHETGLLKENFYRKESWSASNELSGAIAQIQRTVDKSLKSISSKIDIKDSKGNLTGEQVFLYQPKSYLIIGSLSEFVGDFGVNEDKYSSFEILRRNMFNPEILTFDELFERAKYLTEHTKFEA